MINVPCGKRRTVFRRINNDFGYRSSGLQPPPAVPVGVLHAKQSAEFCQHSRLHYITSKRKILEFFYFSCILPLSCTKE